MLSEIVYVINIIFSEVNFLFFAKNIEVQGRLIKFIGMI